MRKNDTETPAVSEDGTWCSWNDSNDRALARHEKEDVEKKLSDESPKRDYISGCAEIAEKMRD